jgi:hypothetical protein
MPKDMHNHMTPDGAMTGPPIESSEGHYHILKAEGVPTATAQNGMGHTHRIPSINAETLGPRKRFAPTPKKD